MFEKTCVNIQYIFSVDRNWHALLFDLARFYAGQPEISPYYQYIRFIHREDIVPRLAAKRACAFLSRLRFASFLKI